MLATVQRKTRLLALGALLLSPAIANGQAANPDPARFAADIARFERWDTQNTFPEHSVLFVGSSSIVNWPTADRFPGLPVINRGFGGSQLSDANHYIEQTVLKYAPDVVVLYEGNNDIQAGKTPQQVLGDFQRFVSAVHARKSDTRIIYISIHPSIARWALWPKMKETNELIRREIAKDPRLQYVDISARMLGANGEPMPQLYVADGLHMTPAGYDVWTPIVARAIASARSASAMWTPLFNGKDLTGWTGDVAGYAAENGLLVAKKDGGGNLYYHRPLDDFVLRLSFRLEPGGNNGVGIRAERGKDAAYYGMEIQILDDYAPEYAKLQPYQYHGSIYGVVPAVRGALRPAGEWNEEEIRAEGTRIRVTLNGKVIVDADIAQAGRPATIDGKAHPGLFNPSGYIGFLGHGHRVEFRDIMLMEL
jgi:lysophospholipase L1-like esterase